MELILIAHLQEQGSLEHIQLNVSQLTTCDRLMRPGPLREIVCRISRTAIGSNRDARHTHLTLRIVVQFSSKAQILGALFERTESPSICRDGWGHFMFHLAFSIVLSWEFSAFTLESSG
jgi:hypothetical protein